MKHPIVYLSIKNGGERLNEAQKRLEETISYFDLNPLPHPAGKRLELMGRLLLEARKRATKKAMVWCNSDVILTRNPFDVPNPDQVYGFYRREIPSGEICSGVDMLYIPLSIWDEVISKDIPKLFLGASYVDWWIPRLMQHLGAYENLTGYIDHVTHPTSLAAGDDTNYYYQANFNAYNKWARRYQLVPIPEPAVIPYLGHVWGVRDAFKKAMKKLRLFF